MSSALGQSAATLKSAQVLVCVKWPAASTRRSRPASAPTRRVSIPDRARADWVYDDSPAFYPHSDALAAEASGAEPATMRLPLMT